MSWFLAIASVLLAGVVPAESPRQSQSEAPSDGHAPSAVVVCPSQFRETLAPWLDYRREQGHRISVVDSAGSSDRVASAIRHAAAALTGENSSGVARPAEAVLIVGDAPPIGSMADPTRQVPVHYRATTVSAGFGSTPTLGTDLPYGDFDRDGDLDAAVGRLPVDTPEQLSRLVERIRVYEASQNFSFWRDRVELVGGVGGFGMLADAAIESVTRMMVTASLPTTVRTSVAYGSPGHLFYPRRRFTETITERFNRGCRFWVYAGHGLVNRLDRVPPGPSGVPVLDGDSLKQLRCPPQSAPIAILLCCYTGAIDATEESLAEEMLLHEGGPIAVIAGNRVTMPYGNASLTMGLIDAVYGQSKDRRQALYLGDAWRYTLRRLHQDASSERSQLQAMIDGVAALVSPAGATLDAERREHAVLYSLLGDPLLRMHPPCRVEIETATGHDAGKPVTVSVTCPIDGQCTVMVDHPLGQRRWDGPGRTSDPNYTTLVESQRRVVAGRPEQFRLTIPEPRSGVVAVRVHVAGQQTWASGAAETILRPKTTDKSSAPR